MGRLDKNNMWKTSVSELLSIFRGASLSIIPWVEKAKIKWHDNEAYDDWDNIILGLYQNIVCSSLEGEVKLDYAIAKYGFEYVNYSELDYIIVKSDMHRDKLLVFVSFNSLEKPFDSVKVAVLGEGEKVMKHFILNMTDLKFAYAKRIGNEKVVVEQISVLV